MVANKEEVLQALKRVKFPGLDRDIVSFGFVKDVEIKDSEIKVVISFQSTNPQAPAIIQYQAQKILRNLGFPKPEVLIEVQRPQEEPQAIPSLDGVRYRLAVASGKGGVGKSSVAINLACGLVNVGWKVGLCDMDIYGPSQQMMLGLKDVKVMVQNNKIMPIDVMGMKAMSMGFLVEGDKPVIWRGPMVMKAVSQFLRDVNWGVLDCLVFDLPPGTGDAQLTLAQAQILSGAIIVTTPQDVALLDARKGLKMFQKVDVPVLGLIENMAYFQCPHCKEISYIFGKGQVEKVAKALGMDILASIPLDEALPESTDKGKPLVFHHPQSPAGKAFQSLAYRVKELLDRL